MLVKLAPSHIFGVFCKVFLPTVYVEISVELSLGVKPLSPGKALMYTKSVNLPFTMRRQFRALLMFRDVVEAVKHMKDQEITSQRIFYIFIHETIIKVGITIRI